MAVEQRDSILTTVLWSV